MKKNGTFYTYKVTSSSDPCDSYKVSLDLESKIGKCECQFFEFMGIVCRHLLSIFQQKNIFELPSQYILGSWTKEVNKGIKNYGVVLNSADGHHMSASLRNIHVCHYSSQLSYFAEKSQIIYEVIISDLDNTLKKVSEMERELFKANEFDMSEKNTKDALVGDFNEEQA